MRLRQAEAYAAMLRERLGAGALVSVHLTRGAGRVPSWFIRVRPPGPGRVERVEYHSAYAVERALDAR